MLSWKLNLLSHKIYLILFINSPASPITRDLIYEFHPPKKPKFYLQTPRLNLATQRHLLNLNLVQFDRIKWTDNLADDIVARVTVEAENYKVQRHRLQLAYGQTVEREVFLVDGISRVADDAGIKMFSLNRE